jgi:hypothetical protein
MFAWNPASFNRYRGTKRSVKPRSLQRLNNIDARFGAIVREVERDAGDAKRFHLAWERAKLETIGPTLHEFARDLEQRGFRAEVCSTEDREELRVFLRAKLPDGHRLGFQVIDRGLGLEVLAYLEASPPVTDIARYQPATLTEDVIEQIVVDALEHIFAVAAELR